MAYINRRYTKQAQYLNGPNMFVCQMVQVIGRTLRSEYWTIYSGIRSMAWKKCYKANISQ